MSARKKLGGKLDSSMATRWGVLDADAAAAKGPELSVSSREEDMGACGGGGGTWIGGGRFGVGESRFARRKVLKMVCLVEERVRRDWREYLYLRVRWDGSSLVKAILNRE